MTIIVNKFLGGSRSNSSHSSQEMMENSSNVVPTITILSPNNGRSSDLSSELQKSMSSSNKRESETLDKEKAIKIARISESGQQYEKENVDPRRFMPPVSKYKVTV